METTSRNLILDEKAIRQKIRRIALEIMEDNYDEQEIILAGICHDDEGYALAGLIKKALEAISDIRIILTSVNLNKMDPVSDSIELGVSDEMVHGKVIILVDDVADTGRTLLYAVKPLLAFTPRKIRIAVLVDRQNKNYPVSPDFVGLSLTTTMQEHITVSLSKEEAVGVYLS